MRLFYIALGTWSALATAVPGAAQSYTFETFRVPYPPGNDSVTLAQGIDNYGRVTGWFDIRISPDLMRRRGFIRHPGGAFEYPITAPWGYATLPRGINSDGTIVGHYQTDFTYRGFVRVNGQFSSIDLDRATDIHDINNRGDMVGRILSESGRGQAFLRLSDGTLTIVSIPGISVFRDVWAMAVAWDRAIAGCYRNELNDNYSAFVRGPKGNYFGFTFPGIASICATGINNAAGKIAGWWVDTQGHTRGFIYDYRTDLAEVEAAMPATAAAAPSPIPVRTVRVEVVDTPDEGQITGINSKEQIVGYADRNYKSFGFIGTPVVRNQPAGAEITIP